MGYVEECIGTLKVGMTVYPTGVKKNAKEPKTVFDIRGEHVYLELQSKGKMKKHFVSPATFKTVVAKYEWMGKPQLQVVPVVPTPESKRGNDNLSPMWAAIRDCQARLAFLEKELDVRVAPSNGSFTQTKTLAF
jgi:hypothetical protein